ncbi:MAG: hypothetical protein ACE5HB_03395 [Terriglobia bacterium]
MGNSVSQANSTTARQVRKALRRTRLYRDLQKRVSGRLRIGKSTVSKAASGRFPGRYKRAELALLQELARYEPQVRALIEAIKAEAEARRNGGERGRA